LLVLCRARRSEFTTLRGGHRLLKRWLDGQEALDGLSLPPALRPAVRIMNLHKAKGLEARVVFLSDPSGIQERLELHVDRNVEPSQGYLLVQTQSYGRSPGKTLARHPDWPRYEAIERDHLRSEEQRLLYVAATRAGQQLLISQNAGRAKSVWGFFAPHMEERPLLAALLTPAPPTEPTPAAAEPADPVPEPEAFAATWQRSLVTSEQVKPLKQWALGHVVLPLLSQRLDDPALRADHGADWGTLIHTLLEMRLREPDLPSTVVAAALLDELELSSSLVPLAVNQVETVAKSLLWRRARRAPVCLTEVPVDAVIPGTDLLVRGVIDLAFQELLGWILVDYKTDRVPRRRPRPLTEHYRPQLDAYAQVWEQVRGMKVLEYGFFWVRLGESDPLLLR
ncbi:MAG TPA: PD-(D/E)XK nuclease family protein, partial [Gemmatales bacterium]|nr:PD-(D/E)XK nuclease family protein [Gemmatales bacterium]